MPLTTESVLEAHGGFLVPPWYQLVVPSKALANVASIFWGFSLACACFTATKATRQSWLSYKRHRLFNLYVGLIWVVWATSLAISVICWLYLNQVLHPSFWTFFAILIPWAIQLQCILQIVANRVTFLIPSRKHSRNIKISILAIVTFITVTTACTWMPARLQISPLATKVNDIWDRFTKGMFALTDLGLNVIFLRLVYRHLIANGLAKYWHLFHFNVMMIIISISLDIALIGVMSLDSPVVYMQFNPLVFLIKLHIELNLAEMIANIVQSSNPLNNWPSTSDGTEASEGSNTIDMALATIIASGEQSPQTFFEPSPPPPAVLAAHLQPLEDAQKQQQQKLQDEERAAKRPLHRLRRQLRFCGQAHTRAALCCGDNGLIATGRDVEDDDDGIFPRGILAADLNRSAKTTVKWYGKPETGPGGLFRSQQPRRDSGFHDLQQHPGATAQEPQKKPASNSTTRSRLNRSDATYVMSGATTSSSGPSGADALAEAAIRNVDNHGHGGEQAEAPTKEEQKRHTDV